MGMVPRCEVAESAWRDVAGGSSWLTQSELVLVCGVLLVCLLAAGPLTAMEAASAGATGQSEKQVLSEETQQVPTDHRVMQQLQQLEQQVRRGRVPEIRDQLRLLSLSSGVLLMPRASTAPEFHHIWEPLFRVKFRTIHGLTPGQLRELRREHDPLASVALMQAMTGGRLDRLVDVIHHFPGCEASYRAHLLLARAHVDRGNSLAAMSWLQPLLEQGVPADWKSAGQTALQRLEQRVPEVTAVAGGNPGPVDSPARSSEDPGDTAAVSTSLPAELHWQYEPPLSPLVRDSVDRLLTSARQTGAIPWTCWEPATDDQWIFSRTLRGIAALDRRTGIPVWNWTSLAGPDTDLQQLAERGSDVAPGVPGGDPEAVFISLDSSAVSNLLNRNSVTGRLTCDAERLFLVEDAGRGEGVSAGSRLLREHAVAGAGHSELIALDKATGRRVWSVGGDPIEAVFENDLTAAWIAGPPTVSGANLLTVMEQRDVILLACLSAETGRLFWKLPLVYPATPAGQDPARRITAAVPTVSGGLIWTTTTTGWMVAVDSLTRSVLWAHRTRRQAELLEDAGTGRGRVPGARPHASLRESWPVHAPVVAGTQLIVFPSDAHDLLILDAIRGVLKHRVPVRKHRLTLFADGQRLVLAGSESIQAYAASDGHLLWTTAFQSSDCLPVGSAIIRCGRLVVPMSDGTLHSIDPATGRVEDIRSLPRSAPAWGGLSVVGEDVLSFSPREILVYANASSGVSLGSLSEQAEALLRKNDPVAARKLLEAAEAKVGDETTVRRLRFRVLSILADVNGQSPVTADELGSLAVSGPEHARVLQHRINTLRRSGRLDEATELALKTLNDEFSVQRQSISSDSGFQLLRTWLLASLDAWLDDSDERFRRSTRELVLQQPTEILLGLHHPVAGAELLCRIENEGNQTDPDEQSIHMVLQAVETMRATIADTSSSAAAEALRNQAAAGVEPLLRAQRILKARADRLAELTRGVPPSNAEGADSVHAADFVPQRQNRSKAAWTALRWQLLRAVARDLETGRESDEAETREVARESVPPADSAVEGGSFLNHDTRRGSELLAESWSRWPDGPYTPVPVSQFVSFRQSEKLLIPLTGADPFLNESDWQWLRTPTLLKAVSGAGSGTEAWSVPCIVNDLTPYSVSANTIDRQGSVVLIRTSHTISGISVLDQRTLWNRRFPYAWSEPRSSANSRQHTITRDSILSTRAADPVDAAAYRVCGASARWLCLQSRSGLEVLDLLTGEPRWSLPVTGEHPQAFATGRVVVMMDAQTRSVRAVRTSDGIAAVSAVTSEMFDQTLLATAHELVLLRAPASDGGRHTLEWVDPVSGEVVRRMSLPEARSLQFLDQGTLVAVSAEDFHVVRLVTGESLQYSLWNSAVSSTPPPSAGGTAADRAEEPAQSMLQVFADPVNFYVFPRFLTSRSPDLRFLGRELVPVDGPIRAIDRQTGRLRWVTYSNSPVSATFDQPVAPVLLLMQPDPKVLPGNQPGVPGAVALPRVSFRGILKTTGSTLFEHRLSSRYPLPFVRLLTDPDSGIDIEAFGSRVRFVADRPR